VSVRATDAAGTFKAALDGAVGPLQRAVETLLGMGESPPTTAMELTRQFGIEQTLAWRIWRLAHARSGAEAAQFVIGAAALETFLAAAARFGAPPDALGGLRVCRPVRGGRGDAAPDAGRRGRRAGRGGRG
jgi:hypothetical protein